MTTTLLHEVTTLGYTVHIRRSPRDSRTGAAAVCLWCPQAMAANRAVIEHPPGAKPNGTCGTGPIARRRRVQRDESTRQPFSAIRSVVKRTLQRSLCELATDEPLDRAADQLDVDLYCCRVVQPRSVSHPDAATEGGSIIRRLLRRVRSAWENGSVWLAFVIGVAMGPSLDGVDFVLAIIVASGVSFGVQITAAITFVIAMLTVEEIILVSHLARPAKSQAFLRRLNDWALARRRKLVVAIFAVVGVSLMAQGMGGA